MMVMVVMMMITMFNDDGVGGDDGRESSDVAAILARDCFSFRQALTGIYTNVCAQQATGAVNMYLEATARQ